MKQEKYWNKNVQQRFKKSFKIEITFENCKKNNEKKRVLFKTKQFPSQKKVRLKIYNVNKYAIRYHTFLALDGAKIILLFFLN